MCLWDGVDTPNKYLRNSGIMVCSPWAPRPGPPWRGNVGVHGERQAGIPLFTGPPYKSERMRGLFGVARGTDTRYYGRIMNKARILVVDDQQKILDSLAGILSDEGHEVILARDGQEALHIVQSDSPDVVFLDIWIPGIDGMQTLKAIKRIDPRCSVIMMSGHGTIETAVKAIKQGAADYLEKPLNLEDVLHLVNKSLSDRSRAVQPHEAANGAARQLIGKSARVAGLRRALENAAAERGAVWLTGEKGTGKEFLARIIHHMEGKDRNSLVKVRCTDLTPETMEETLLGKSGPGAPRQGKMQQAKDGTLLLVRVDRVEKGLRPRLAEIIKDPQWVGSQGGSGKKSRFRIISTSVSDPDALVQEDDFPSDLAEALGHRIIRVPTLRERSEDIPLLADHFLKEAVQEFDRNIQGADSEAMARLLTYSWPGNVKELKILMEHVVMTAPGPTITVNDLLIPGETEGAPGADAGDLVTGQAHHTPEAGSYETRWPGGEIVVSDSAVTLPASVKAPFLHQKTVKGRVVMYGLGLHSGVKTGLTLSPLPPGSGILFGRITSGGTISAVLQNVQSTELSTCLKGNGSFARTIEHLMAVFHVYGLTNVLVKISGEVPIMDGSAVEFCKLVESAEIIPQDELVEEVRLCEPIELPLPAGSPKSMRVEPSDALEVEYHLKYPPPVGSLSMTFRCTGPEGFKEEIAPARTFGFVRDMRMMAEMGLADGGRLSNVILIDEDKVVNPPLRFPDEFVRHKILDIIGDFYLLGRPFIGRIVARQTGHSENIAMLKLISEKIGLGM